MRLFCPACGRTTKYNADVIGLTPKICPCCLFLMEQSVPGASRSVSRVGSPRRLRPFGLTFVQN